MEFFVVIILNKKTLAGGCPAGGSLRGAGGCGENIAMLAAFANTQPLQLQSKTLLS
jgi:hypothetical protein